MSTMTPEYLTTIRDGFADALQQWVDQSTSAWDQWQQAWSPAMTALGTLGVPGAPARAPGHRTRGHRRHEEGCGCGDCDRGCREHTGHRGHHHGDGCGCGEVGPHGRHRHGEQHHHGERHDGCGCADVCDCCVPEADVIVRARAGEVRVVPFRLHNPWRREREVALEVGPWHGCDGDDLEVRGVLEDQKIVLAPCEDRVVRLVVSVRGRAKPDDDTGAAAADDAQDKPTKATRVAGAARAPGDVRMDVGDVTRRGGDVESCASAYADVRFEGCARPQRVAVVVLPADCDSVDVDCDCGCC